MKQVMIGMLCSIIISCNNETGSGKSRNDSTSTAIAQEQDQENVTPGRTGNGQQSCNTENGEKWSTVLRACIMLSDYTQIQPKDPSLDPAKPAYLVFDSVRVEIFLPTQERSVIIRKSTGGEEKWVSGPLTLRKKEGGYRLEDEGKLLYESAY